MDFSFFAGLVWLSLAGAGCLFSAQRLKRCAMDLLTRAFGESFSPAFYAMLTLPGFFLHEGAHALTALLLGVPIRGATFIPRRAGADLGVGAAVQVARRDTLRMAMIALAPLLVGTVALGLLSGVLTAGGADARPWVRLPAWLAGQDWRSGPLWVRVYLLWSIGSHMAPSATDMRYVRGGALALLALLAAAGLLLALVGEALRPRLALLLGRIGDSLAVAALLNLAMLVPVLLVAQFWRRR